MIFKDRKQAGKKLANLLEPFKGKSVVIYALPRGGVVVGAEIAQALGAPLDLIITRKIGHPFQPEYAIGAVAENGHSVLNKDEIIDIGEEYIKKETEKQKLEAKRRREVYLGGRKPISCKGSLAILTDDGIATGLTIKAAIKELKLHYSPKRIIVAVPVAPKEIAQELEKEGVEFVALNIPEQFYGAIGAYYKNFAAVSDEDIIDIMKGGERYARIYSRSRKAGKREHLLPQSIGNG